MLGSILAGITSFLVAFTFLPFIISFSEKKKFLVNPGGRRIHKKVTPSLGGVAVFLGFTFACICWIDQAHRNLILILPVLIIPFIIGLLDDLLVLKPIAKLIAQVITASLIFFFLEVKLTSFYGLLNFGELPLVASYLLTLTTVIIVTNSFNLIDGIDGLAATFSFIASLSFGVWYFSVEIYPYAVLSFALCGAILAFLFQNWEPSKIFMGDTGSLVIGTMLSILMIRFINENDGLPASQTFKFDSSVGAAISVMIIPLVDTIRIIIVRATNGLPLFKADKRHIHHVLVRLNLTHRQSVYILTIVHIFFIVLAGLMRKVSDWYFVATVTVLAFALCLVLDKIRRGRRSGANPLA